ncbi:enoyl-CoA hydratase/isomerase family protein [Rhizophagus clarus]|uniref:Enoyl-CoA hydratase/isomerase family protein n=1 Tax=Rhizophagus clarus TaxID=94130 RepID=A0A8H3MDP1_9GLOM|nr:enoyl-CoA hydratase/isomerase family protein [Rhizophagus clarus]
MKKVTLIKLVGKSEKLKFYPSLFFDKVGMENKENVNNDIYRPKFLLPSITSLPNPSPLTSFYNHESTNAIFRGNFAPQVNFPKQSPLNTISSTQPFEDSTTKQDLNTSIPKYYAPNANYDPNNTSYTTTNWPTYYFDCPYQSNRDTNGSTGPPYNVSTCFSGDIVSMYNNNRQECLENPIPTRSYTSYYNNNGRYLPPLNPNFHSINSSPSSHHLGRNSAFTNVQRRNSDITGDQPLKLGSEVLEGNNNLSVIQHTNVKSDNPLIQTNIGLLPEESTKRENYDETTKTEGNKEKKKGRSNWTRKETRSLISAVKLKHKLLLAAQRNADKSRIWSDMFSDHCTRFSGRTLKAFKLRWARLAADYSSVYGCIKSGVEPMDFDYYDEMKEILDEEVVTSNNTIKSSDHSIPTLKRKFDDRDEKVVRTSQIEISEDDSKDYSLVLPSLPRFDGLNEVEDTQRKCDKPEPERGNSLTLSMINEFLSIFQELENNSSISIIIITGKGKYFCTGMDLQIVNTTSTSSKKNNNNNIENDLIKIYEKGTSFYNTIKSSKKVIISKINGPVIGGGIGLMFVTDIRICNEKNFYFCFREVKVGLLPAIISQYIIPELGSFKSKQYMLTGEKIFTKQALDDGIISISANGDNDLNKKVEEYTKMLLSSPPKTMGKIKKLVQFISSSDIGDDNKKEFIKKQFIKMMKSKETNRGTKDFNKGQTTDLQKSKLFMLHVLHKRKPERPLIVDVILPFSKYFLRDLVFLTSSIYCRQRTKHDYPPL